MLPVLSEALRQGREAYREFGRGALLVLDAEEEPTYGAAEDLIERLSKEPDAKSLLASVIYATGSYDPLKEAVTVTVFQDSFLVHIIRANGAELVGGVGFVALQ
ncbi:MAG: hypothetical protein EDX89_22955 [Acidobacteria bacterium]|nr:MAG: hypothetical protein EDX89_22955 [Acidobacteriota bacterium]MCE7884039.1 hypothetical protein [Actinobacteria bacterium ATB1]